MLLLLIGKSGCGKSVIAHMLIKNHGYEQVITCTTRQPREGEVQGRDYHFMSDSEFRGHIAAGDFIEYDCYGKNWYGTLKSSLISDKKLVLVITPEGADTIKKEYPETFVVHINPSMKTSVLRAITREKELDPGKLDRISVRATQDYYLFNNPYADLVIENEADASLVEIARQITDEHEKYPDINAMLRDMSDTLRESRKELEEYDRRKKS